MTRVKICGLNDPAAFDAAVGAGADAVGFVFFAASPRAVTAPQAAALSAHCPAAPQGPLRVGLFVEPTLADIAAVRDALRLDALQVYGTVDLCRQIRAAFDTPVWRAVGVRGPEDLPLAMDGADLLLIEAKAPTGASRPGGNAQALEWSMLRGWQAPGPWMLAGGLTPDNVARAMALSGATAVDVSSGVESAPGVKDPDLIRRFVAAARAA